MQIIKNHFTSTLIDWFSKAKRDLPWRRTKDPYRIWLSEIILQQTRIDQGMPYYERFVSTHPTVHDLAQSDEVDVLKLWEGLGYYSRARNLHATAKHVSSELNGQFPNSYSGLLQLKGVGPYTAAAIASIAFDEAVPVVDGNVFRFVARYFGVSDDISKASTRKVFENILTYFIPQEDPGEFNQAVMEFGSKVCSPAPNCEECPFRLGCFAFKNKSQSQLPVKLQKTKVEEVTMDYLIFQHRDSFLLQARSEGIWHGLYQFYLVNETEKSEILNRFGGSISSHSEKIKHLLSHRKLWVSFIHVDIDDAETLNLLAEEFDLAVFSREEMLNLPRPKVIVNYLQRVIN